MSSSQECGTSVKLALKRWPFLSFFFPNQNQFADRSHRFTQFLSHFLFVCPPWPCADIYTSFFLIFLTLRRVSSRHSRCLSVVLTPPPSFLTQFGDKAADWWWHDCVECTALSGSYPRCPRQSWQCCHGWMNTVFWHGVRQCQITNLCSLLSSFVRC